MLTYYLALNGLKGARVTLNPPSFDNVNVRVNPQPVADPG